MATTFDTPVLITDVGGSKFRLFRGAIPTGSLVKAPRNMPSLYRVRGPLAAYYRLSPPERDITYPEVLEWLDGARRLGCDVEVSD